MLLDQTFPIDLPHAVLDGLPNPVFVKDAQRRMTWINPAFETFFDVDRASILETDGHRLIPDWGDADQPGSDRRILRTGVTEDVHQTVFTANGHPREMLIRKSRLDVPEQPPLLLGIMHDVSDVMRANALLREDRSHLADQAKRLQTLADCDTLTGAYTRRALFERVQQLGDTGFGLMLMDIDHFKKINDRFGHAVGDQALVHFCRAARGCLRSDDVFARVGGEEFAVVLPCRDRADLAGVADRIRREVAAHPLPTPKGVLKMTVSIGGASVGRGAGDASAALAAALEAADQCMYRAKQEGRNRVVLVE
ncbi:MAG: diguanylate cyclase [Pseudomonadota bacterium]